MVTSSVAPAVRCTDLSVVRGGLPVLTALSLDVAPGQVIGLLGPSGCGKTTLMRSIVGTQVVRDGTVTVLGHPAGAPQLRRSVAYATQSASVYDDLTVRENVRYFAATLGASRADVARVVEHVDLGEVADRLTGGSPAVSAPGSASRSRCSASRSCWSSTSPRSGSIPCCANSSGRSSPLSPGPARHWSSPAT